jgi:hypothetical protein
MHRTRLEPGCDWHREIERGCEASRVVLPVLTPRWQSSDWTRFETYGAEAVIPLLFEGSFEDVAPAPLQRFQAHTLHFADGADSTDWQRPTGALQRLLAEAPPEKAIRVAQVHYHPGEFLMTTRQRG